MSSRFQLDRWNWSQKAEKWVYISIINSKRIYRYRSKPPNQFLNLTNKIRELNQELVKKLELNKINEVTIIYNELMELSKEMQMMKYEA